MFTIRELPDEEYYRMENHPYLTAAGMPYPQPEQVRFVVTEKDGEIIGFWVVALVYHLEPVYVEPQYRGQQVAYKMWEQVKQLLAGYHIKQALCLGDPTATEKYLSGLGLEKLPYSVYQYKDK